MDSEHQGQCELSEDNMDFLFHMVDYYGTNGENSNDNDILMTMDINEGDEEGDDDVFENVLINNSSNFCQTAKQQSLGDSNNNTNNNNNVLSSINTMDNFLSTNNENKENNDNVVLPLDRNNNNSVSYNTIGSETDSNGSIHSTSSFNDGVNKVYCTLQNSKSVAMTTNSKTINNNNNNNIDWSSFGDFDISDSPFVSLNNGSNAINSNNTTTTPTTTNNSSSSNKSNSNNHDNQNNSFQNWSQRNNSSSGSCCTSSRHTSCSSSSSSCSLGSSNNSNNIETGSSSSRNSSCSSYSGAVGTTNNGSSGSSSSTSSSGTTTASNNSSSSDSKEMMLSAYMEACRSGQLTPILKEELKFFIQARRLSQGKDEMAVQFTAPSPSQLSAKEVEKIERRKKQNRQAAKRFRQKQKGSEEVLLQKIKELEGVNTSLFEEAQILRGEKQKLMDVVAEHLLVCPFFSLKSPIFPEGEWNQA